MRDTTYTKIHNALYDLAKSDFTSANVLTQNQSYPQAIYLYAQTFEKATKAVVALYLMSYKIKSEFETEKVLRRTHGHKLTELTKAVLKPFVDKDKELYISKRGKEADEFVEKPYRLLEFLSGIRYSETQVIGCFHLWSLNARQAP